MAALLVPVAFASASPAPGAAYDLEAQKGRRSKSSQDYDDLARTERPLPWRARPVLAGSPAGRLVAVLAGSVFERRDAKGGWTRIGDVGPSGSEAHPIALRLVEPAGWRAILRDGKLIEGARGEASREVADVASEAGDVVVAAGFDGDRAWAVVAGPRRSAAVLVERGTLRRVGEVAGTATAGCLSAGVWRMVAGGTLFDDADGSLRSRSTLVGVNVYAVAFADARRGWIGADRSMLAESSDGGTSWLPKPVGSDLVFEWVGFRTPTAGLAVAAEAGGGRPRRGHLYATEDGGATWRRVGTGAYPLSAPVEAPSGERCILDGGGTLLSSKASGTLRPSGSLPNSRASAEAGDAGTRTAGGAKATGGGRGAGSADWRIRSDGLYHSRLVPRA